jgi:hypothetical protein
MSLINPDRVGEGREEEEEDAGAEELELAGYLVIYHSDTLNQVDMTQ